MTYTALYRALRPKRFDEMVNQEHVVTTLKNALVRGQIAHAYLFSGPRGTGKTSVARLLAKAVNCEKAPESPETVEPCNECKWCDAINQGASLDVIEIDAASNRGVDEIRDLREKVRYASTGARRKVYIIDEVHMLTPEAFNALLKTLEDPPEHVMFVLATTEPHKIPLTIASRCQRFDFHFLAPAQIEQRLVQIAEIHGWELTAAAAHLLARYADGAMRDALSLLDQCRSYGGDKIDEGTIREILGTAPHESYARFASLLAEADAVGLLVLVDEVNLQGLNLHQYVRGLVSHFRDLLLVKIMGGTGEVASSQDRGDEMKEQASLFDRRGLLSVIDRLAEAEDRMRWSTQPRLVLEMIAVQLAEDREAASGAREIDCPSPAAEDQAGEKSGKGGTAPDRKAKTEDPGDDESDGAGELKVDEGLDQPPVERSKPGDRKGAPVTSPAEGEQPLDARQVWQQVMDLLSRRSKFRPTVALLAPAQVVELEGDRLVLQYSRQWQWHRDSLRGNHLALLGKALERVTGRDIRVVTVLEPENDEPHVSPPDEEADPFADDTEEEPAAEDEDVEDESESLDPGVQQALQVFGGVVLPEDKSEGG